MNPRVVIPPIVAGAIAIGFWMYSQEPTPSNVPAATWRLGKGAEIEQAKNYAEIKAGTALRLSFVCAEPRHVYVFSHSAEDGTLLMFPSPELNSDEANPLPTERTVLPGKRDGKEQYWGLRDGILATTTYVVVAAKEPVAELTSLLPHLRCWTNTAMQDGTMGITHPNEGIERKGTPRTPLPSKLLQRAAEQSLTATLVNGPLHPDKHLPDVWIGSWRAVEKKN